MSTRSLASRSRPQQWTADTCPAQTWADPTRRADHRRQPTPQEVADSHHRRVARTRRGSHQRWARWRRLHGEE